MPGLALSCGVLIGLLRAFALGPGHVRREPGEPGGEVAGECDQVVPVRLPKRLEDRLRELTILGVQTGRELRPAFVRVAICRSHRRADPVSSSRVISSPDSVSSTASAESSMVSGRLDPGIGMTTGAFANIQARQT